MGLRFRRSVRFGPFRVNLSTRGVGVSAGVKGARVTLGADGRVRETLSLPGTGLSYVEEHKLQHAAETGNGPHAEARSTSVARVIGAALLVLVVAGMLLSLCDGATR